MGVLVSAPPPTAFFHFGSSKQTDFAYLGVFAPSPPCAPEVAGVWVPTGTCFSCGMINAISYGFSAYGIGFSLPFFVHPVSPVRVLAFFFFNVSLHVLSYFRNNDCLFFCCALSPKSPTLDPLPRLESFVLFRCGLFLSHAMQFVTAPVWFMNRSPLPPPVSHSMSSPPPPPQTISCRHFFFGVNWPRASFFIR